MRLKSFGCSFIFGTDLSDDGRNGPYTTGSCLTWPALLAADCGYQYQTHARPGSGNLRILETVLQKSVDSDSTIFVVGWTWIDRFDYTVAINEPNHWDLIGNDQWKTIRPVDPDRVAKNYYRDIHSQIRDKLTTLIYIKTAIDTLKQKNIPFVMTYMDELIFETQWHVTPAIVDLQNYVRPYMTQFENKTFLDFSKQKEFPLSKTLHPLEAAHQAAFELIKSYNLLTH
jgi:hypothetical protein